MKKIKFGIVGYGKIGKIRNQTISSLKNAQLKAIHDISKIEIEDTSIKFFSNYEEFLKQDIDAVIISTYAKYSSEYTIKALKAGKHVFCEKPPSLNSKEIKSVIQTEELTDRTLKYGFNHRYHYSVIEAKKIIDSGSYGKLLLMRGVYGKAGSIDFDKNWRQYKKYSGGGILFDQGIHMIDLFRFFSNEEFECVGSHISKLFWDIEFEDNAFVILKSKNNIISSLHSSATQWKHKFNLEIIMEKGYLVLDGLLSSTRSYAPEKLIIGRRDFENTLVSMGKPNETTRIFEKDDSWKFEIEEFINAISNKTLVKHGNSHDAYQIMKLLDAIYSKSL